MDLQRACPCGSGTSYDGCCGRLHRGAAEAATAEELMRSRYSAYALTDADHLFRTWHPRTRPEHVLGTPGTTWTGLEILELVDGGPDDATGIVEFRASYIEPAAPGPTPGHAAGPTPGAAAGPTPGTAPGRHGVLHERSSFERRARRWVYVSPA